MSLTAVEFRLEAEVPDSVFVEVNPDGSLTANGQSVIFRFTDTSAFYDFVHSVQEAAERLLGV